MATLHMKVGNWPSWVAETTKNKTLTAFGGSFFFFKASNNSKKKIGASNVDVDVVIVEIERN